MFDAARKDGIYPVVREGYRTYEEQQKILDDKIKAYINEGYSQSRAERTAKEWVALPGTSEHQLGIAVDINADKSKSSNDEVYTWLAANLRAIGDAYTPLIFLIISAVLNVALDILCVKYMDMGVRGAAVATIVSQAVSAVLCFGYTWKKYAFLHFNIKDFVPKKEFLMLVRRWLMKVEFMKIG